MPNPLCRGVGTAMPCVPKRSPQGYGHGHRALLEAVLLRALTLACCGVSALDAQASRAPAEESPKGWGAAGRPSTPLGVEGGQGHLAAPADQMRFLETSFFSSRCGHHRIISPSCSRFFFHLPLPLPDPLLPRGVLGLQLCFHARTCFTSNPSFLYPPQSPFCPRSPFLPSTAGQPASVGDSGERFSLPRKTARSPPVPLGVPEGDKGNKNKLSLLAPGKNPCCSENKAARGSRRVQVA